MEKERYAVSEEKSHGMIINLYYDEDYGFIRKDNGVHLYFHSSAAIDDFQSLRAGHRVSFYELTSPKGLKGIGIQLVNNQEEEQSKYNTKEVI